MAYLYLLCYVFSILFRCMSRFTSQFWGNLRNKYNFYLEAITVQIVLWGLHISCLVTLGLWIQRTGKTKKNMFSFELLQTLSATLTINLRLLLKPTDPFDNDTFVNRSCKNAPGSLQRLPLCWYCWWYRVKHNVNMVSFVGRSSY
jgi:hypothetical protein